MPALAEHHRSLVDAIGQWWREYRRRQRSEAELAVFGPVELERMAHDIGVSAGDLQELARMDIHAADEAPQMMAALGLDVEAWRSRDPALLRDIELACTRCGSKGQCRSDLEEGTASTHYEEYCVNASTFEAMSAIRHVAG